MEPQTQFNMMAKFADFTGRVKSPEYAQQGIKLMGDFGAKYKQFGIAPQVVQFINTAKDARAKMGDTASAAAADKALEPLK